MSKIKILIPIYNDWKSVFKLLEDIDLQVRDLKHEFSIIIVNDCSTEEKPINDFNFNNLHFFTKYCLIFFMIVGRIEMLTILIIFKKFLFKN